MRAGLDKGLTLEGLWDAAKDLAKDRAPGLDGVNIAFYSHHWEMMGPDFLRMVNEALIKGKLPKTMTQGLITLLYKSGPKEDFGNWRPITLLNTAYKILAKVL